MARAAVDGDIVELGSQDGLFGRSAEWVRLREVSPSGALLVRPYTIVAWRAGERPDDPAAALDVALHRLAAVGGAVVP